MSDPMNFRARLETARDELVRARSEALAKAIAAESRTQGIGSTMPMPRERSVADELTKAIHVLDALLAPGGLPA